MSTLRQGRVDSEAPLSIGAGAEFPRESGCLFFSAEEFASSAAPSSELLPSTEALSLIQTPRSLEAIFASGVSGADQQAIDTFMSLAWAAVAWRRTGASRLAEIIKGWKPLLQTQEPMRITGFALENRDLMVGHALLAFAIMADVLRGVFDPVFETALRRALLSQAAQTYADLTDREIFPAYSYEQNHMIIPVCGLGIAAMSLGGGGESVSWGSFARDFLTRSFEVIGQDGWFFEGVGYWNFTMQFPICYALALKQTTGESLFMEAPFKNSGLYLAHMVLPDARFVFDFADWGPRVEPDGTGFQPGYDQPWHSQPTYLPRALVNVLAREQGGGLCRRLLARLPISRSPSALDASLSLLLPESAGCDDRGTEPPVSHYFPDMEVLHWRGGWEDPGATALAFKSGPPAGHHLARLLECDPAWHLELGHAHPDAGSFLLFAHGVFLANDTGYTGKKETADHNSLLVDGIGQHRGGTPWSTFNAKPYREYDQIRMEHVWHGPRVAAATAVFTAAYDDALELTDVRRSLILVDGRFLIVCDTLRSTLEHEYEWRLHTDRAATQAGDRRFVMENGPGRLILETLGSPVAHRVAPTVVETECFSPTRSRPQQRGFHLALTSPRIRDFRFLVAVGIQSSVSSEPTFSARLDPSGRMELSDAQGSCTVWLGGAGSEELDGAYACHLRDAADGTLFAGMLGRSLTAPGLALRSPGGGFESVCRA